MKEIGPIAGIDHENTMTEINHAKGIDHQSITKMITNRPPPKPPLKSL